MQRASPAIALWSPPPPWLENRTGDAYCARYYDAQLDRFLSEDPVGFSGGINFYRYVYNNPVGFIDPTGLDATVTQSGSTVTVTASIVVHSSMLIRAQYYKQAIGYYWKPFQYDKYIINFKVKVVLAKDPRPSGPVNDVYIKASESYFRSYVTNNHRGLFWSGADANTIAHETGHFFGFGDKYDKGTVTPYPGYAGEIMGEHWE